MTMTRSSFHKPGCENVKIKYFHVLAMESKLDDFDLIQWFQTGGKLSPGVICRFFWR